LRLLAWRLGWFGTPAAERSAVAPTDQPHAEDDQQGKHAGLEYSTNSPKREAKPSA
jgi:hypothetical protein